MQHSMSEAVGRMLSPLLKSLEQIWQVNMVASLLFQCGGGVFFYIYLQCSRRYHFDGFLVNEQEEEE